MVRTEMLRLFAAWLTIWHDATGDVAAGAQDLIPSLGQRTIRTGHKGVLVVALRRKGIQHLIALL